MNFCRPCALRLAAVVVVLFTGVVYAAGDDARGAAVDALFAEFAGKASPGIAVGVAVDGEPVLTRGYGLADLEHSIPIQPSTVFHVASVSKQFTAFAAALLAADGKLDLDADIREVLPELPDFGVPITARQLVHHTSGLKDQWTLFELGGMELDNRLRQRQIVRMASRVGGLNFPPGTDYTYSNTGYTLLAELVARISGQSFREFADARIFAPLEMQDTLFYDDVTEIVPHRAQSYEKDDDGKWHRSLLNFDNVGATSLHTTVVDLLRWGDNFSRPAVGRGEAVDSLFRMSQLNDGTPLNYGFGLQRQEIAGHAALWHSGSDAGYRSIFAVFPAEKLVIAILANSPVELLPPLAQLASIYLDSPGDAKAWQAALPSAIEPARETLDGVAGHYYAAGRSALHLRRDGDALVAVSPGGEPQKLTFREDGSFDFGDEERLWGRYFRPVDTADGLGRLVESGISAVAGYTVTFQGYEPRVPSAGELMVIAGDYRSEALDITYSVLVKDGELAAQTLWSAEPVTLHPTIADHYGGGWPLDDVAVERGGDGRPVALSISSLRARDVRLRRIDGNSPSMSSARLDHLLEELAGHVPGVAAAVATPRGIAWSGAAGWSNLEARRPMRPDELFGIGSITKTFVSVILHQLASEGRVELDAAPASYLGDELDGIANVEDATLYQLMNHTSGIPSWEDQLDWQRDGRGETLDPVRLWGKTDTLAYIVGKPALFPPGARYSYSNSNFTILGRVIEVVTGNDIVDEIEARIRRPAGLEHIYLEGFEPVPASKLATRYHFDTRSFRESAGINPAFRKIDDTYIDVSATNLSVEWAAGGMVANATDLARYAIAIFDGTLLDARSLARLQTFRLTKELQGAGRDNQPLSETGYGVFRRRIGEHVVMGHGGDVLGYSAWLYYVPEHRIALAVLANAGTMHAGPDVGAGSVILGDGRFIDAAIAAASGVAE